MFVNDGAVGTDPAEGPFYKGNGPGNTPGRSFCRIGAQPLLAQRRLGGRKARDRHAVGRAAHVVEADLVAELKTCGDSPRKTLVKLAFARFSGMGAAYAASPSSPPLSPRPKPGALQILFEEVFERHFRLDDARVLVLQQA